MSDRDSVTRLNAALTGRYEIERQLGQGGMATVYLAQDLRHKRWVALKVLKPELAAVVGAERFLAEITTTANLQHPHILPLYDSGEADGLLFYVMPHVQGESLRERLAREHQLPVDEAVRIATNVAEALDYAHAHGVIHRDIKPANILLQAGKPVVSDFGIALAVSAGGAGRLTETGLSLGTPHYMSPEQATGDLHVGPATDIYALGCVLYEMLVGEPPYTGSTPQAVLGKIVTSDPEPVTKNRRSVPLNVDAVIRKALEKVPADRFASAAELARALGDRAFRHGVVAMAGGRQRSPWRAAAIAGATGALLGILATAMVLERASGPESATVMRFVLATEGRERLVTSSLGQDVAMSPDGRHVVHVGVTEDGRPQLYLRSIEQEYAVPVPGAEGGEMPFFSPDGAWIGFVDAVERTLVKRVPMAGGPVESVGRLPEPIVSIAGATWSDDGRIIVGTGAQFGLFQIPAGGGAAERLTQGPHHWPSLVGTDAVLFMNHAPGLNLAVLDLSTGEIRDLGIQGTNPLFVSTGHLVYVGGDGSLQAVPFDAEALEAVGAPVVLRGGLDTKIAEGGASMAVARNGHLVYTSGFSAGRGMNLVRLARDGSRTPLTTLPGTPWYPRFSPEGGRVAYGMAMDVGAAGESDLWVYDLVRGSSTRVTFAGDNRYVPTWTPDGRFLTHSDATGETNRVLSTAADGSGAVDTLLPADGRRFPTSWSPDGSTLAIYVGPQGTATNTRDLAIVRLGSGAASEEPLVATPFAERGGAFSPDGRWLAYVSDRSGRDEVYARPFPGPGGEITVSVGGGDEPVWAASGTELYYRTATDLMVVMVESAGPELKIGPPAVLFRDGYVRDAGGAAGIPNYGASPSGDGFVMVEEPDAVVSAEEGQLHLVLNFVEELKLRVPN